MGSVPKSAKKNYNALVLGTIQNVLLDVFGERTLRKIRQVLKDRYSLEWQEIPEKSEAFSSALKEILGKGAVIIEDLIVENLYKSLGKDLQWRKDYTFSDYISSLSEENKPILRT